MQQTVIVVTMHTRTTRSYTTTERSFASISDALEAANYLASSYDAATGEPVGDDRISAEY